MGEQVAVPPSSTRRAPPSRGVVLDAPSCSAVYLDKPMRNHTLMQTIARANRVYPGKHSGMIVDYANVFASLERALAIYGAGKGARTPVQDKQNLVDELRAALAALAAFCAAAGVDLSAMEGAATSLLRLTQVSEAVNALVAPDERRKAFLAQARLADRLYAAVKPHPVAAEFALRMSSVTVIADGIRQTTAPGAPDLSSVLQRIGEVLDRSIAGVSIVREAPAPFDLSKFDFKALADRFKVSPTPSLDIERLKAAIRAQLDRLIAANETRVDFREKFEALIDAYNAGSTQIAQLFLELLKLTQALSVEETRHVREHLEEDELVVFDLLTRPGPDLTTAERDEVKKVTRQLLERLRSILLLDWQKTALSRARVREAIEDTLDAGLPRAYTPDVFKEKTGTLFDHVYRRYGTAA